MLQEMIDLMEVTNKNFLAEFGRLEAYLKALMQTPGVIALQHANGDILFTDYDEEMVLVRDLEGMDALWIEGINSNGQPIYSDVLEGTTNTWHDYPVDFLIKAAMTLKTILEEKEVSTRPSITLDADLEREINEYVNKCRDHKIYWNLGRADDNRYTPRKSQVFEAGGIFEGLPSGVTLRYFFNSPYAKEDRSGLQWFLSYESPW